MKRRKTTTSTERIVPGDSFWSFAGWTTAAAVLGIGLAELFAVVRYRGASPRGLLWTAGMLSMVVGVTAIVLLILGTYLHIRVCKTLRKQRLNDNIPNNQQN